MSLALSSSSTNRHYPIQSGRAARLFRALPEWVREIVTRRAGEFDVDVYSVMGRCRYRDVVSALRGTRLSQRPAYSWQVGHRPSLSKKSREPQEDKRRMKARTSAAKRRLRKGRPMKPNAVRTETGRLSRSVEAKSSEARLALEASTWRRRQDDPELTVDEAVKPEHGNVIMRWLQNTKGFEKKYPDKPNFHAFTQMHYDAAVRYHELHCTYLSLIGAKLPRSASDFTGPRGADNSDPFEASNTDYAKRKEQDYKAARRAILKSGPMGMMAMEAIVLENKDVESLRPDLRCACNNLARLWNMTTNA